MYPIARQQFNIFDGDLWGRDKANVRFDRLGFGFWEVVDGKGGGINVGDDIVWKKGA